MGKTSKWLRNFLTGKKDKVQDKEKEKAGTGMDRNSTSAVENPTTQTPPKEKRRWSFRRLSASETASRELNSTEPNSTKARTGQATRQSENDQREHSMAVVAPTMAAAQAATALIPATACSDRTVISIEEAAAIKIQSVFRSFLARKALCALKGLVKLQALVRGHLVRKQATATLRCMEALVTAQARVRAQRIRMSEDVEPNQRHSIHRKSTQENRFRTSNQIMEGSMEENVKIVEMDYGESNCNSISKKTCLNFQQHEWSNKGIPTHCGTQQSNLKQATNNFSPAQSALTDVSPRACSGHFEDYSLSTAQSSPQHYSAMSKSNDFRVPFAYAEQMDRDYPLYPNYMANTESSRAKARSQSAPKLRPASCDRQPIRRRASVEGRNVPRGMKMQRSSSHLGSTTKNYQYPWSLKLDRSTFSVIDSECGSTSTALTNTNYCRSLVAYDHWGDRYYE